MAEQYSRVIPFENIFNFRDLGGYKARGGKTVAWQRIFRSGSLLHMTTPDKSKLKDEIRLKTVIDLSSPNEERKLFEIKLLKAISVEYLNIPFRPDIPHYYREEIAQYKSCTDMGVFYLCRINYPSFAKKLIQTLEIIAEPAYRPLLFHCGAGKDRTGVLAAMLLNLLGVSNADIIGDYVLTDPSMEDIRRRICNDPETSEDVRNLPEFTWRALPEFMNTFLSRLEEEYGGATGYFKRFGADKTLVKRLEKALLV